MLAKGAHRFERFIPPRYVENLSDARDLVTRRKFRLVALVGIFVVSPLPSAQLFVAAGFLDLPLRVVTAAFLAGRVVTYTIYVTAATLAAKQFSGVLADFFGSPWSIAVQLTLLVAVCALPLIPWRRFSNSASPTSPRLPGTSPE